MVINKELEIADSDSDLENENDSQFPVAKSVS